MFNQINENEFWYEYISFEELYKAYEDCKKRKRITHNCEAFEISESINLYKLYLELNNFTYKIGRSTVFIYHEPATNHFREIFAADFRDRVIQHLIVNRILPIFEYIWNDRAFSCREGKGTSYGVEYLYNDIKNFSENYTKNCLVISFDIYSFFASLNKDIMFNDISKYIKDNYELLNIYGKQKINQKDIVYTLYLIKLILYNDPRKHCIFKQPKSFWNNISHHKSAFYSKIDHYLAVGNITSQLFANIFISILDIVLEKMGYKQGRYVDDMYILIRNINEFNMIENIVESILQSKDLKLQKQKTHIQPYQNGIQFIGKVIKKNRIYILNKTKGKFIKRVKFFNDEFKKNGYIRLKDLDYIVNCINSYLGMFKHYTTFKLRKSILESDYCKCLGKYVYIDKNYFKIMTYQDYRNKSRKKHKYYKELIHQKDS